MELMAETKKALVVVDMLNDFIRPDGSLTVGGPGLEIVPFVREQIEKARAGGIPVIYLCDQHRPDDPEFRMFPPHCIAGTEGGEVISELRPQPGDWVVPKRRYSGFYESQLDLVLRELEIEEIMLVGVCTNICVLYTASDARNRAYQVTVLKDGVATFDPEAHEWALKEMEKTLGARIA